MTTTPDLELARAAFARHQWLAAAQAFADADRMGGLDAQDLGRAGLAAHLSGDDAVATSLMSRSHQVALEARDPAFAALMAFWLGMMLANRGEMAVAGGWLARSGRLVAEHQLDTVVLGYLLVPQALQALEEGDAEAAFALFERAAEIAERFHEVDLATMSRLGRGQSLIALGEVARGVAYLDDAMLTVTSGEAGPVVTGIVYCASIEAFHRIYDLGRAQGWTEAMTRWRSEEPDLIPFRGRCLVYRAELMQFHGDWSSASAEVRLAEDALLRPPPEPAAGEALYLKAELSRLAGELDVAETAYRQAAGWGRRPEPGLALLRLAQGHTTAAMTMLKRAIDETPSGLSRAPLLDALVTVAIASDDLETARAAADELARLAAIAVCAAPGRDRRERGGRDAIGQPRATGRPDRLSPRRPTCGRPWMRRTSRPGCGRGSGSPAGISAMPNLPRSRWRRPATHSIGWARIRTPADSTRSSARHRQCRAASVRVRWKSSDSWPVASRIGRSPRISGSANGPSTGMSATSIRSSTCRRGPRRRPSPTSTTSSDPGTHPTFAVDWVLPPMRPSIAAA